MSPQYPASHRSIRFSSSTKKHACRSRQATCWMRALVCRPVDTVVHAVPSHASTSRPSSWTATQKVGPTQSSTAAGPASDAVSRHSAPSHVTARPYVPTAMHQSPAQDRARLIPGCGMGRQDRPSHAWPNRVAYQVPPTDRGTATHDVSLPQSTRSAPTAEAVPSRITGAASAHRPVGGAHATPETSTIATTAPAGAHHPTRLIGSLPDTTTPFLRTLAPGGTARHAAR
jgi:hypothetical protein